MSSRRLKPISMVAGLVLGGLTLLAWTMPWFVVRFAGAESTHAPIEVPGQTGAPALAALGLAALALIGALAIAGPVFRVILGILEAGIGLSVCLSSIGAIADPVAAAAPLVSDATGISGEDSVRALVESATATAWPIATLVIGLITVGFGIMLSVTSPRWPSRPSRYQAVRLENADEPRSAVSDWDSLSDGDDPTSR